jgi:hypothetical protein
VNVDGKEIADAIVKLRARFGDVRLILVVPRPLSGYQTIALQAVNVDVKVNPIVQPDKCYLMPAPSDVPIAPLPKLHIDPEFLKF